MKKTLAATAVILLTIAAAVYIALPHRILTMVTDYAPVTFEDVLGSDSMREDFGIGSASHPADYGYQRVEDFAFSSLRDQISLDGWYIERERPGDRCLVLVHGRTSNRLKPMKYLALFRKLDLDTAYNFFLPDLRNSGRAQQARTFMGYKFAEDLCAGLIALAEEKGQTKFTLYGFSMGAMAIYNLLGRADLQDSLLSAGIHIEMLITDSPLVNVKATLGKNADDMNLPGFIFERTFRLYSRAIEHSGERMNLHKLMVGNTIPWLILQSEDDRTTLATILREELALLDAPRRPEVHFFSGPDHVQIYQSPETQEPYIRTIRSFFENNYGSPKPR